MSGMPGITARIPDGGIGFDYRLAMGLPDMWIRLIREQRDENWNLDYIWHELSFRMAATIAYVESHDQALVGDQTIMFRLAEAHMYTDMDKICHNEVIDRAMALHKMLRLVTAAAGGNGYLNFMGNEFGHPEWIDFPREGNGWDYKYCRRQWSLPENGYLKYGQLELFDRDMIRSFRKYGLLDDPISGSCARMTTCWPLSARASSSSSTSIPCAPTWITRSRSAGAATMRCSSPPTTPATAALTTSATGRTRPVSPA